MRADSELLAAPQVQFGHWEPMPPMRADSELPAAPQVLADDFPLLVHNNLQELSLELST
jgi:hypothetical protein